MGIVEIFDKTYDNIKFWVVERRRAIFSIYLIIFLICLITIILAVISGAILGVFTIGLTLPITLTIIGICSVIIILEIISLMLIMPLYINGVTDVLSGFKTQTVILEKKMRDEELKNIRAEKIEKTKIKKE